MGNEKIRSREKTSNLFSRVLKRTLAKPEQLTVSQWAEKYRVLDESSSIPGKWSNDVTPYLIEIMDSFNDPYIEHINFCKPTQVGGTEALLNEIGWIITQNPSPTMIVYPTDDLAKDISNDKLKPAFLKSPSLKERFLENQSKELSLKFKGMNLYLRGANSPSKLASKAIKFLMFDEIDKMSGASKKEASPYDLAIERTKTFKHSKKIYSCSTPTLKNNYVWRIHEAAEEQRHYFVPCPHCGEMIELKWSQVIFEKDKESKLTISERAATAKYICQECGCLIEDREKPKMLRLGQWKSINKKCVGKPKTVSFWLNSLYSIFVTWEDMAKKFLESRDDPDQLQNFINSWLAEPWEDTKLKTNADLVLDRQTEYEEFIVPSWAKMLTGGVDVQENCLYWSIRAWGNFITSQNICHGQAFSFAEIEKIMNLEYCKKDGTKMVVNLTLMDSGYDSDSVYDFASSNSEWCLPVKGASNPQLSHYKLSKVNKSESKAYGMNLVIVDGGKYKDMIAGRMKKDNGKGAWMVYKGCDREYAEQVTAEHKVNVKSGNRTVQQWVLKKSHADNHYLDTEVYALAAADVLGVRTLHLEDNEEVHEKSKQDEQYAPEEGWIKENEKWI
ncbi:terminase gpA endonuclease subunit [Clostridium botulinum]|uniref:Phage terminase large subunit family protein n=1 Tax=Clostridium botulinum TaxID=1491 RepID=A0A0M1LIZ9_CLOBO|nr:terminase gpA endonuclease subunit [Clostridium botulinum]KAI3350779.1 phage terminase large subunit family protein [Clostridium botulinum]KOM88778.1 terminase [Clostridium botulinum]KOR57614.1 terminase [Clostridium botulinum]NFE58177.1 phage terminase large subunit family protein [Clostridium botulinum]NFE94514.1 phage terminase large subunit family protein [Clostridium botulinum]